MEEKHPSHETRFSDSSFYDEVCIKCGAHDETPGGWGELALPCPTVTSALHCEDFGFECCAFGPHNVIYSPAYLKYGSPNLWGRFCSIHHEQIALLPQIDWTTAMMRQWKRALDLTEEA